MLKPFTFQKTVFAVLFSLLSLSAAAQPLITGQISNNVLTRLPGNTRPEATSANDRGVVADSLPLKSMMLQLQRSAAQEQALTQLIDEMHNPKSPYFHQWLTPAQIGAQFGTSQADLEKIVGWLVSQGFVVDRTYPNRMAIAFSGTAGQVRAAFHTEIHHLKVNGADHIANMSDPMIPAALTPAVAGVVSLHDFKPNKMMRTKSQYTAGGGGYFVTPPDLATIYNFNPVFASGNVGQNQSIYLVEDTDLYSTADWTTFRATFGLSGYTTGSLTTVHPSCGDPGVNGDDGEAILDAEYASAAAPGAAIFMATCANSTTSGVATAIENLVNEATPPAIISVSYGECEATNGATANQFLYTAYQTGAAAGVSIYVASGDSNADTCDRGLAAATHGVSVSGWASTPYNVAVGGTDFAELVLSD